jgi:hypothetical protein
MNQAAMTLGGMVAMVALELAFKPILIQTDSVSDRF